MMNDSQINQQEADEQPVVKKGLKLRTKLVMIFVSVMMIPVVLFTVLAWNQIMSLGYLLRDLSVSDATTALNDNARDNLERMTTDTAMSIAEFLYQRDRDILMLAQFLPSDETFRAFSENRTSKLMKMGEWVLSDDQMSWVEVDPFVCKGSLDVSSNRENNDIEFGSSFNYRPPEFFEHYRESFPLYDEITFINLNGQEIFKFVNPASTKVNYPMNPELLDISDRANTYVRAETYWEDLQNLRPGEIYVSDVIGAYVGTNFIGMYTPGAMRNAPQAHANYDLLQEIANLPLDEFYEEARRQAFAGFENPLGQRFEGIIRWATPIIGFEGEVWGYVTMALNHDHIMEFVDFITPMPERYSVLSDAHSGNYAFLWDYKCRNIVHPRHHSIVGYNPVTGEPQVPWLEGSVMMERNYEEGGFVFNENNVAIPILDVNGEPQPARDTPFYYWYSGSGSDWLEDNPTWYNLSEESSGISWGQFYEENKDNREILPQFGERQLRDANGNLVYKEDGTPILDYQSRTKTPARVLTRAGFVALDGRFLNNAPQCTGWMDLTEDGGSGSFYIYWSNVYKPTTAGAVQYYTGKFSPEVQGNRRGIGFVTIGAGLEDFTEPAVLMGERMILAIDTNSRQYATHIIIMSGAIFALTLVVAVLLASAVTRRIKVLIVGLSRFRQGDMSFRLRSKVNDEFGQVADSFDEMADSLEESMGRAEQASIAKSTFLSNMSHEIRTPLNAIIGMTTIGITAPDLEKKDYSLNKINDASKHLLGIINDILDMSKIEANKYSLSKATFRLEEMIHRVVDVINFRVEQKHQKLTVHIDPNTPNYLIGDDQRLAQVITNLLSNAVKFTAEDGSIHLEIMVEDEVDDMCTLLVVVSDTGIGMSKEQQSRLFMSFEQAEASTSRRFGGTGLGLVISKTIVEMMGGEIWIESELGDGSVISFTVRLGFDRTEHIKEIAPRGKAEEIKLLITDEDMVTRVFFEEMSYVTSITCDIVTRGEETLAKLEETSDYDLFFVAGTLPDMTGVELAHKINSKSPKSKIVMIMSGVDWEEQCENALEAGVTTHIPKPLFNSPVIDCVNELLFSDNLPSDTTENNDQPDFEGHTILLVEDVDINREIVMALLEPSKLSIDYAVNGINAIEVFCENPEKYELIFMDLQMPEMDGITATEKIRALDIEHAKNIPIVAMTANAFQEDIDNCLAAGMNGHLGKPLSYDMVIATLEKYLHGKE
ncbi:MAG: response regulator [Oscillospiraceae bacterium]|nr:response regulator [Oscillospiraceae bacterium]